MNTFYIVILIKEIIKKSANANNANYSNTVTN